MSQIEQLIINNIKVNKQKKWSIKRKQSKIFPLMYENFIQIQFHFRLLFLNSIKHFSIRWIELPMIVRNYSNLNWNRNFSRIELDNSMMPLDCSKWKQQSYPVSLTRVFLILFLILAHLCIFNEWYGTCSWSWFQFISILIRHWFHFFLFLYIYVQVDDFVLK